MEYKNIKESLNHMFDIELKLPIERKLVNELKKVKNVIIYGAGNGGKYTKYLLSKIDLDTIAFLDINAGEKSELDGIPVYLPDSNSLIEKYKDNSYIIISVGNATAQIEIAQKLKDYGYINVISYMELFNNVFLTADDKLASAIDADYYYENKDDIFKALSILSDDISCETYYSFVRGHALNNKNYFPKPINSPKYIPDDIEFNKDYRCFIDCGAGNGETFLLLEKNNIIPKNLFMFEADKYNFNTLSMLIQNRKNDFTGNAFLWPCAVYSRTDSINFNHSGTAGSCVSDFSNDKIKSVALDDVLINVKPTFIKMDIEGAEYEALVGAKNLICNNKPDIAICIYHSVNHIWDIPLLINSWNLNYKFYLRSHTVHGMNTLLYAISE